MRGERQAGGLWCHQVLEQLSDYLDGELTDQERSRVEAHLAVCDICERFGGDFAHTIRTIRSSLQTPTPLETNQLKRLHQAFLGLG